MPIARLNRTVIALSAQEGSSDTPEQFLLGLITNNLNNDINFAALLTPQGKIIADFFVIKDGARLLIDVADKFSNDLLKRLKMYKLRAKIDIAVLDSLVFAAWGGEGHEGYADPRHDGLGRRIISDSLEATDEIEAYNLHRLSLGVPDSTWDFETATTFPADANMDLLSGVDYKKGCFVGQEVVSRMHRKTEIRKRMKAITGHYVGELGALKQDGIKVGTHISHFGDAGMTLIRMDKVQEDKPLTTEDGTELALKESHI